MQNPRLISQPTGAVGPLLKNAKPDGTWDYKPLPRRFKLVSLPVNNGGNVRP
jgi:hypothetical protein